VLCDRATFPRDKPCGGALSLRAVREQPMDVESVVERRVDRLQVRYRSDVIRRRSTEPLILMTQRRRLDDHLLAQAAAAGAEIRESTRVALIAKTRDGFRLTTGREVFEAEILIGADGANGRTGRLVGLPPNLIQTVALEGNIPHRGWNAAEESEALFEFGSVRGGYGWIFPKGDHANVGVWGWPEEGPHLRRRLVELCGMHGVAPASLEAVRGHLVPLRRPGFVPARGRALLVGDAAGLVDPLTGDGMYEAFVSARLAAEAALDVLAGRAETVDAYSERLSSALAPLAAASWAAKIALDRFPRATFALARAPLVWPVVERLVRGDIGAPREARGLARPPLKAIAALARLAGAPAG
jgi:geranylgeranyl reductase family protein